MQPNTLTLAVDVSNTGVTTDVVFTRHEEGVNRTKYISPSHSLVSRDELSFLRTAPKRTGAFYGSAKTAVKYTRDITVAQADGLETRAPLIVEIAFSLPVGAGASEIKRARQLVLAALDRDDVMDPLNLQLSI